MRWSSVIPALLVAAFVAAADESDVIDLNPQTFGTVVDPAPLILVEFFAPWCGHCKALAPEYEQAATQLKPKDIKLAKVDCVEHAELCQSWGVQGYPTLKVFRNGTATDYNGPRKADGIVSYMVKQSLPAVSTVTAEEHEGFKKADKIVLIAYLTSATDAPGPEFDKAAEKHREDYLFGRVIDPEVIESAGLKAPSLILYRSFDEPKLVYDGSAADLTAEKIEEFVKSNEVPLLDQVGQENYGVYAQSGLPLAYVFVDPAEEHTASNQELIESLKPVAKKFQGVVNFVSIDSVQFSDHARALNLLEVKWPAFVVQDLKQQLKYPLTQSSTPTPASVLEHVQAYVDGKLEPSLKSEPVPEKQDEPVYVLTGKEFDKVVFDEDKDIFVEFYAPWCGHCKRLKPTWDSLGEHYSSVKDKLTIAKMDATENDVPPSAGFRVAGFPTLKFKKAGEREFVDYDGDRSLESLIEFVETNAKNKLELKSKAPESSTKVAVPTESVEPLHEQHDEL